MNEIINLMRFDFIALRRKSFKMLGILFLIMCVAGLVSIPYIHAALVLYAGFSVQPIFIMAEKSDFNKLYGVLPVKRRNVGIARFALTFLTILATAAVSIIAYEIIDRISLAPVLGGKFNEVYEIADVIEAMTGISIPGMIAIMVMLASLIIAIEFTMIFIFGADREILASGIALFMIIAVGFMISKLFDISHGDILEFVFDIYENSRAMFYCSCYGISTLLFVIGAAVSSFFFTKKEL